MPQKWLTGASRKSNQMSLTIRIITITCKAVSGSYYPNCIEKNSNPFFSERKQHCFTFQVCWLQLRTPNLISWRTICKEKRNMDDNWKRNDPPNAFKSIFFSHYRYPFQPFYCLKNVFWEGLAFLKVQSWSTHSINKSTMKCLFLISYFTN